MILIQAIRNAMVNDLVVRNVADLAAVPTGKPGRPSRSLNLEQALAVLDAAKEERLWPYVAVSMLGGIRTEEARALRWSEVDLEAGTVAVYRSVRRTGETKTEKSRRVFQIPEIAVEALGDLVLKQAAARAKAGTAWKENDLVFCTSRGGPMYATDVRMEFKRITEKAASAGTGRRASSATPLFRSCPIPAYPSSRSRTRWATPAPGRPRSSTDTNSARLRVPPLSR
jgi:integrase